MDVKIIEIKARCDDPDQIRNGLNRHRAEYRGLDHQRDTYFVVPDGRLKLRSGNIENSLIYYNRNDQADPKLSEVSVFTVDDPMVLRQLLGKALKVLTEVVKKREIYFIGNVKIHIDSVDDLGTFVEIEAIGQHDADVGLLRKQCLELMADFGIDDDQLVSNSYSDMILQLHE